MNPVEEEPEILAVVRLEQLSAQEEMLYAGCLGVLGPLALVGQFVPALGTMVGIVGCLGVTACLFAAPYARYEIHADVSLSLCTRDGVVIKEYRSSFQRKGLAGLYYGYEYARPEPFLREAMDRIKREITSDREALEAAILQSMKENEGRR